MLEQDLRDLFQDIAAADQPPTLISIPAAARRGHLHVQARRAGLIASPAVAAAAVLAITLTSAMPASELGLRPAVRSGPSAAAPRSFNVARSYAWFGWLPEGLAISESATPTSLTLAADNIHGPQHIRLYVNAAGSCRLRHGVRVPEAAPSTHPKMSPPTTVLDCPQAAFISAPYGQALGNRVGTVAGQPAYWSTGPDPRTEGRLVWQYARGGWAALWVSSVGGMVRPALDIAKNVRLGPTVAPPTRFAFQFTGLPRSWHLASISEGWQGRTALVASYAVTSGQRLLGPGQAAGQVWVMASQPGSGLPERCPSPGPGWHRRTVDGYRVWVQQNSSIPPPGQPVRSYQTDELCTRSRGVYVAIEGATAGFVINLFVHHLRVLGPDPATWTTQPITR